MFKGLILIFWYQIWFGSRLNSSLLRNFQMRNINVLNDPLNSATTYNILIYHATRFKDRFLSHSLIGITPCVASKETTGFYLIGFLVRFLLLRFMCIWNHCCWCLSRNSFSNTHVYMISPPISDSMCAVSDYIPQIIFFLSLFLGFWKEYFFLPSTFFESTSMGCSIAFKAFYITRLYLVRPWKRII